MMANVHEIHINEEQRRAIAEALRMFNAEFPGHAESELLEQMFAALPKDEEESPGCTHCFNL